MKKTIIHTSTFSHRSSARTCACGTALPTLELLASHQLRCKTFKQRAKEAEGPPTKRSKVAEDEKLIMPNASVNIVKPKPVPPIVRMTENVSSVFSAKDQPSVSNKGKLDGSTVSYTLEEPAPPPKTVPKVSKIIKKTVIKQPVPPKPVQTIPRPAQAVTQAPATPPTPAAPSVIWDTNPVDIKTKPRRGRMLKFKKMPQGEKKVNKELPQKPPPPPTPSPQLIGTKDAKVN